MVHGLSNEGITTPVADFHLLRPAHQDAEGEASAAGSADFGHLFQVAPIERHQHEDIGDGIPACFTGFHGAAQVHAIWCKLLHAPLDEGPQRSAGHQR
jgi:hypothetical protein